MIVPTSLQAQIPRELHKGYISIAWMKALARSYFWWPRLDQQIETLATHCDACESTAAMLAQAPHHPWQNPNRIYVASGGYNNKYFLVVIDVYTK